MKNMKYGPGILRERAGLHCGQWEDWGWSSGCTYDKEEDNSITWHWHFTPQSAVISFDLSQYSLKVAKFTYMKQYENLKCTPHIVDFFKAPNKKLHFQTLAHKLASLKFMRYY